MSLCCGTCLGSSWRWTNCSFQFFFWMDWLAAGNTPEVFLSVLRSHSVESVTLIYKELFENCKNYAKLMVFLGGEGLLFLFPSFSISSVHFCSSPIVPLWDHGHIYDTLLAEVACVVYNHILQFCWYHYIKVAYLIYTIKIYCTSRHILRILENAIVIHLH